MHKVALISGGSSGIGLACARTLAKRGYRVALLARDPVRLQAAADLIQREAGSSPVVYCGDVTDERFCIQAVEDLAAGSGRLDWLITCAGIVEPSLIEATSVESLRRQMETNYFGSLNLVVPAIDAMRRAGGGRMTLVASGAAFMGLAGYGGYAPSKFAVRALAEVLRVELAQRNIEVSVACPPDTDTPQLDAENKSRPAITRLLASRGGVMSADDVARKLIAGAEAGRFMLTPSMGMWALSAFSSLYAPFFRRKQARMMRRLGEQN
jgi:3-dehydrosphinganine reductase